MSIQVEKNVGTASFRRIGFNHARDVLLCTTENGYSIINCCPVVPIISKNLCQYGFSCIDIYKRSNIFVFSGTDRTVKYKSNTLYIFDDSKDSEIARLVFEDTILSCQVRYNYIIAILNEYTYIYTLNNLTLYSKYNTYANPKGICALELFQGEPVIATLGKYKGTIRLSHGKKEERIIRAHESAIGCLCLSKEGDLLASASVRGSVIRVFDTNAFKCVGSIRRGHMHAVIVNMEFDRHSQYLLCNSDTTVHIAKKIHSSFSHHANIDPEKKNENLFSSSFMIRYSNPDHSKTMLAVFGSEPESVYIVTSKGTFQKLSLDDRNVVVFQNSLLSNCHL